MVGTLAQCLLKCGAVYQSWELVSKWYWITQWHLSNRLVFATKENPVDFCHIESHGDIFQTDFWFSPQKKILWIFCHIISNGDIFQTCRNILLLYVGALPRQFLESVFFSFSLFLFFSFSLFLFYFSLSLFLFFPFSLMTNWWRTDDELMTSWWRADDELMTSWWRTDGELMPNLTIEHSNL